MIYEIAPIIYPRSLRYMNQRPEGESHEFRTINNATDGFQEAFFIKCLGNVCNICRPTVWSRLLRDDGVKLVG